MRISHEAIYQALFVQGRGALRREPTQCLLTGRALREAWFDAPDAAPRCAIAERIQVEAMGELPFVPLGAFHFVTAHQRDLVDRVQALPLFWGIRRA